MATIGSSTLQIERVMLREPSAGGGYSYSETFRFRTKDVTLGLLGAVIIGDWSPWQVIPRTDLIYVDESGNAL